MFNRGGSQYPARLQQIFNAMSEEYQALEEEANSYKRQVAEYEKKLEAQIAELVSLQNTLFDLETAHNKIKSHYDEEISVLRRQLELQSASSGAVDGQGPAKKPRMEGASDTGSSSSFSAPLPMPSLSVAQKPFEPKQSIDLQPSGTSGFSFLSDLHRAAGEVPAATTVPATTTTAASTSIGGSGPLGGMLPAFSSLGSSTTPRDLGVGGGQSLSSSLPLPEQQSPMKTDDMSSTSQPPQQSVSMSDHQEGAQAASGAVVPMEASDSRKAPTQDWVVVYNTSVKTNVSINLIHTLEHDKPLPQTNPEDPTVTPGAPTSGATTAAAAAAPGLSNLARHEVCCVKFSHDGRYLATGSNRIAQIFDVETGDLTCSLTEKMRGDEDHEDLYVRSVCFSPDDTCLATGAEDKVVKVWDIATRTIRKTFVGHELDIYSLDWSSDGKYVVSGSGDGRIKIWNAETGECVHTLGSEETGPREGVTSVAFSADGKLVAAGSLDCIVRVWEVSTGKYLNAFEGHDDSVYSVAFSPDGKTLASGSLDKTVKLWDLSDPIAFGSEKCITTFVGHKNYVLSVAFSPDGKWLVSGSKDQSLQFWDPKTGAVHLMLSGHKNSVISVSMNPKQTLFATGSGDFRARVWRYETVLIPEDKR